MALVATRPSYRQMPRLSRFPSVFADIIIHTLRAPIQLVANTNKFLREEMQHRLGDLKRQVRRHPSTGEDLRGSGGSYTETPSSRKSVLCPCEIRHTPICGR